MTPDEYLAACSCPRSWDRGRCSGRDLDPACPIHSLPPIDRVAVVSAP